MVREEKTVTEALRAIVEPRRREILRLVRDRELTSGAIAAHFEVTGPAISQHLGVLAQAGLVSVRRSGTRRLYRAVPERLMELRGYLADFWSTSLDRLASEAEAEEMRRSDAGAN